MTSTISLEYRKAALQQASTIGLVIALYDTLVGNLTRAAAAMDRNDIEARCTELIHGFKILQQLDAMLDMKNGEQTAINLRRFYTHLRGRMLAAQFKVSSAVLREQVQSLLDVREAWQQVDNRSIHPVPARLQGYPKADFTDALGTETMHKSSFSCSG